MDAACIRGQRSPWTIFFSIAMWLLLCGILFSVALGCLGLCYDGLSICLPVGGLRANRGVLRCGKSLASFGAYKGKEITEALRAWRRPLRSFYPSSIILCIFGLRLMCSPYLLAFLIFLLVSLVMHFLLYTPSVLRSVSCF